MNDDFCLPRRKEGGRERARGTKAQSKGEGESEAWGLRLSPRLSPRWGGGESEPWGLRLSPRKGRERERALGTKAQPKVGEGE